MRKIAALSVEVRTISSNDTLAYITETIEYFNGISIDIESIIERVVKEEKYNKNKNLRNASECLIYFGDRIGKEIVDLLEDEPDVKNLSELANFTLRASIAASLYLAEGHNYKNFSAYLIHNYSARA